VGTQLNFTIKTNNHHTISSQQYNISIKREQYTSPTLIRMKNTTLKHTIQQIKSKIQNRVRGRRDCDRMVVGFTTYAISAYHH